jgi:hypothetical protein
MFTTIRTYRIAPDQLDAAMHKADVELADRLAALDGVAGYEILKTGEDRIASITTCRDAATAETTNELATEWVRTALADVRIERLGMFSGEVLVSRTTEEMLVSAHH